MAGATSYSLGLLLPNGTTRWVALFSAQPGPAGGGTEVTAAGYARVAISSWVTISSGEARGRANAAALEFPSFVFPSTLAIEAVGICDAALGGNLLAWAPITPIENGLTASDQVRLVAQGLVIWARP